ncbi:heme-binding protein [Enterococcus sp. DIV0876]|uniref:heme-binding protein n=1 Tax=Enterococcus sp. DIV0876 TaxID=2774633 RepID=UPI003D2FCE9B
MDFDELLDQERRLQFTYFDNDFALQIAAEINDYVTKTYSKPVGIKITHRGLPVLRFLMNGRKESPWLERKETTVLDSGHSSLYTFYQKEQNPLFAQWEHDSRYAICGGGFPIMEKGIVTGAICVSGLDHMEDHQIIVHVLTKKLAKQLGEAI